MLEHKHPPLKFARRHHGKVPRHGESGYAHYKDMQRVAFANAVRELEQDLGARSNVHHIELRDQTLIVRHYSQSKLSQQELADLQKATHFDKKELQQWYKGMRPRRNHIQSQLTTCRFPQGLPIGHAH